MNLKIIVDNNLGKFTGKLSRMTYENIPEKNKPPLISNMYFNLLNAHWDVVIIEIDDLIQDSNLIYLHQTSKDLLYSDIDSINL